MIAGVKIAAVFESQRRATLFAGKRIELASMPDHDLKTHIEELHEDSADIVAHPFIEDGA